MKQAIYIFCFYIGIVTFVTLTLFRGPVEINVSISIIATLVIAAVLFLLARTKEFRAGGY